MHTSRTLHRWKAEERIKYIGVTHYTTSSYPDLMSIIAREKIDFVQFNYSVATREAEKKLLPLCADRVSPCSSTAPSRTATCSTRCGQAVPPWAAEFGARAGRSCS
jgi:aryl-alcohol dehydrogenase-like predicted oxidoreductase